MNSSRPKKLLPQALISIFLLSLLAGLSFGEGVIDLWPGGDGRGAPVYIREFPSSYNQFPIITSGTNEPVIFWLEFQEDSLYAQKLDAFGNIMWGATPGVLITSEPEYDSRITQIAFWDGENGTILIYLRENVDSTSEVFAQKLSPTGTKLWGESGKLIAKRDPQAFLRTHSAIKSSSNLIVPISWGFRIPSAIDYDIRAQKLDSSGNIQWPAGSPSTECAIVCNLSGQQSYPVAASDNAGGAIIAWRDTRPLGLSGIYANRLDSNGNLLWPAGAPGVTGLPVFAGSTGHQHSPKVFEDGSGGAIVVTVLSGGVYAQKLGPNGEMPWGAAGITIRSASTLGAFSNQFDAKSDEMGGALICWSNRWSEGSYQYSQVFVQRIDGSGNLMWPSASPSPEGMMIADQFNRTNVMPEIFPDKSGGAIVFWPEYPIGFPSYVRAQRIDSAGNTIWPFNGVRITYSDTNDTSQYDMGSDGMGGSVMALSTLISVSHYDLYAKRIMGDITSPETTIYFPSTTETSYWQSGTYPINIQWSTIDPFPSEAGMHSTPVTVSYTTDEANYIVIATNQPATGAVTPPWTAPTGETTKGAIRIEAKDNAGYISPEGTANVTTKEVLFQIDDTPPVVDWVIPTDESQADTFSQPIIIQFDDVSPMNTTEVESAISFNPSLIITSFSWSDNDRNVSVYHNPFVPQTTYEVTIDIGAQDRAGNQLATPEVWSFLSPPYTNNPFIDNVTFDGRLYFPPIYYAGKLQRDVVAGNPLIGFRLSSEAGVTSEGMTISVDEPIGSVYNVPGSYFSFSSGTVEALVENFPITLSAGNHSLRIRARAANGAEGISEDILVRVFSGKVDLVPGTEILAYPHVFSPVTTGGNVTISYYLTIDANVSILMYDISGKTVLKRKFPSGQPGGRAGYNSFEWNGVTDFGSFAGNGIYVIKIASEDGEVGTGKLVVMD